MAARFQIHVFGKEGCDKCKVLNRRLDGLLGATEWSDFEKRYHDVLSLDGLVEFSRLECANPQRIPLFVVSRAGADGRVEYVPNPTPGKVDALCGSRRLYQHVGMQTDYTPEGNGVISQAMIESVLSEARAVG